MNRISADSILTTIPKKRADGGMVCVNKKGQVSKQFPYNIVSSLQFVFFFFCFQILAVNVNEKDIVTFLATKLDDAELANEFVKRNREALPSRVLEDLTFGLVKQLDSLLSERKYFDAANLAAGESPSFTKLRT